jgi:hypothetical protein
MVSPNSSAQTGHVRPAGSRCSFGLPPSLPFSAEALVRFSDLSERKTLAANSLVIGSPHFGQFIDF